ncbi:MAG: HAD family phosphatase [Bacteroidales bacterium]|jgi:putative hydrolase of the HAD superfamily|nr:HAD family phosphatase [Bacteroidales bacterium]
MAEKIKNIIFDLGGVVLDIDESITIHELQKKGINGQTLMHDPQFLAIDGKFERGIISAPTFRKQVKQLIGKENLSDPDFDFIWNSMLLDIPRERIQALEQIKEHYNIFLMSNTNEIHYDLYVRDLQLRFGYKQFDDLFDKSYFSFDVHLMKPDPLFFEYIIDNQGLKPKETLFIDDTKANIDVASQLGIHTYLIRRDELVRNLFENGILKKDVLIS